MSESNETPSINPSEETSTIEVRDLCFGYRSDLVLHDVNFSVRSPSMVSIIGPNGVGKSTLVQCINKLLKLKSGTVVLNGTDLEELSLKDLSKFVGYVPCSSASSFPITVVDAVMMGRHPHSKFGSFEKDLKITYDILDQMGISELAMRQLNELSAGQHQKVMLAKGLAQKPKILILDEPTANLDIRHQMNVTRMLRDIAHRDNLIVLMICHDLNIAAKYSDRILIMSEGTVYADGTPDEVITPETISHVYGVDCKVITDEGRPHILMHDSDGEAN